MQPVFRRTLLIFLLTALVGGIPSLSAQESADATPPEVVPETPPEIGVFDVSTQIQETAVAIRQARERMAPDPAIEALLETIPGIEEQIEANEDSSQRLRMVTRQTLGDLRGRWARLGQRIDEGQTLISARLADIEQLRSEVNAARTQWETARTNAQDMGAPDAVVARITEVLRDEGELSDDLMEVVQKLLTLQDQFTGFSLIVGEYLEKVTAAELALQQRLLSRDSAPLWALGEEAEEGALQVREMLADSWNDGVRTTRQFALANANSLVLHTLLFGMLLWFALRMRKDIPEDAPETPQWLATRPFSLAILVSLLFTRWLYPVIPSYIGVILSVLAVSTMLRLVPLVAGRRIWGTLVLIAIVVIIQQFRHLVAFGLEERLLLLLQTLLTLVALIVIYRRYAQPLGSMRLGVWANRLIKVSLVAIVIAALANITGYVSLSRTIAETVASSGFVAVAVYLAVTFLRRVVDYIVSKKDRYRLRMLQQSTGRLAGFTKTLIGAGGVLVWLIYTLEDMGLWDDLQGAWAAVREYQVQLGSIHFSLGQVLAFVITLIVAVLLARLVRMILERELFARIQMPRGIPNTISTIVGYVIVGLGFLVAISAAGMDVSNLGIIIGALGVGIGFGLQNVVNNFISGLILIFERPVQVGDRVQLGDMWGTVTGIGIRASTVKTFDGAEIIVPNGDLVAQQVTNWTRSDQRRRQKLPVKVAFGSDPRQVEEILIKVATNHPESLADPAPIAIFEGTTETGMNFNLMWWVPFDVGLGARNQVAIASHEALRDAGVAAPIPVRRVSQNPPETS